MKSYLRDAGYSYANIWKACVRGDVEAVKFLVGKGVSVNEPNITFVSTVRRL